MLNDFLTFIHSVLAGIVANCICAIIDRIMHGNKED